MLKILFFPVLALLSVLTQAQVLEPGKGKFEFVDQNLKQKTDVYYYAPKQLTAETPLIIMLHGLKRNADEYRDKWIKLAIENGYMVLAPKISANTYPGMNGYNLGNVMEAKDLFIPKDKKFWSFALIDQLIVHYRKNIIKADTQKVFVLGHSAGCQFVHRFMMFQPTQKADLVVCSAAGWYTFADRDIQWPYGLKGTQDLVSDDLLKSGHSAPFILMVGEKDNKMTARTLRRTPEAMAQGRQRVTRAKSYFDHRQKLAADMGHDFKWSFREVAQAGHGYGKVAKFASTIINQFLEDGTIPLQPEISKVPQYKLPQRGNDEDGF